MSHRRSRTAAIEPLEHRRLLAVTPVGSQPLGALSGKIIYTVGGHGYTAANSTNGLWSTQRPFLNSMVEDFGNQDQFTQFVYYAWNAGATIVPLRPVGYQPNEVVLDNTSPGVTFSGGWAEGGATGPGTTVTFFSLSGPNVASRYRFANASPTETAVARYTPNLPQAGFYPVYAWTPDGGNRLTDQTYRIVHTGGATEVKVNHQRVGRGWVYLGTYYFNAGSGGYVEISNKTSGSGSVAVADAIRFGNGMGDIDRGGGVSGHSREDEAALYWIQKQAESTYVSVNQSPFAPVDPSVYRGSNSTDANANVGAPPRWAAYMNRAESGPATDRLFLSFHSNAGGGRGTVGLYNGNNDPATRTPHQYEWALYVAREVNNDLVALSPQLEFAWFNRSSDASLTFDASIEYGEINNTIINDEFDATIVEVAFHDDATDAALLRDPKVRMWVGRAAVQAAVRYFNQFAGTTLNFAPDAPDNVRAITASDGSGDVTVRWTPPVASGPTGDPATGYLIQVSEDGYGFDGGVVVAGGSTTSYTIPGGLLGSGAHYFRVLATNAGGASPPSAVVGAMRNPFGRASILVVNGFDRLDRTLNPTQTAAVSAGGSPVTFERVRPRFSNSFDYVVQAGQAIESYDLPLGFDSCDNQAIISGEVSLGDYAAVVWLSGEESTANDTFNATEQSAVAAYVSNGGRLFVSGAEIGWDLVAQSGGTSFYTNTLKASYLGDDAGTYSASGVAGSIFQGISLSFDSRAFLYDVEFPDRLGVAGGSTLALRYVGGTADGAAIQWSGAGTARVVNMGFPFETITTAANRDAVMHAVLDFFNLTIAIPAPATPDLLASSDTGLSFSDDLTRLNNATPGSVLQFSVGNTIAGLTVSLFADGVLIGSAVANGSSTTITTNGSLPLIDGVRAITARQELAGNPPSAFSQPLAVTIDTAPPSAVSAMFQFQTDHGLRFAFDSSVGVMSASDLSLVNLTTMQTIPTAAIAMTAESASAMRFTFPGLPAGILGDGNYRARIAAADLTDLAGNPLAADAVLEFFVLGGDANRDRAVNQLDLEILTMNWQQSPATFSQGDFSYDGRVDSRDLLILAGNWQKVLSAPAAASGRRARRAQDLELRAILAPELG